MNASIPKKILIVEDSRLNTQITADILNKYGYKTEMVRTGEEAVEKARSSQGTDLILTWHSQNQKGLKTHTENV